MVQFSRKLTIAEQKVAHKTIQRNAFYAHPENILRSMLADNDKSLREKAVAKVIELRKEARQGHEEEGEGEKGEEEEDDKWEDEEDDLSASFHLEPSKREAIHKASVRLFRVPDVNFEAKSYPDLIFWSKAIFSEPPVTMSLSNEEIMGFVDQPMIIPRYPCHTQAVERAIKLVTEAAGSVIGQDARDGYIRQKVKSRKEVGRCHTKKEFFPKLEKS